MGKILQATIGGDADLFCVLCLNDRVFKFSVSSQDIGFHIYKLKSFECATYKILFNLWHGGGPNYVLEYRQWKAEELASWTSVGKKASNTSNLVRPPLTGANYVPVHHGYLASSSSAMEISKFKSPIKSGKMSVFKRIDVGVNGGFNHVTASHSPTGVLGPIPKPKRLLSNSGPLISLCSKCLSAAHTQPNCTSIMCCRRCLCFGHVSGACRIPPRSTHYSPLNSRERRSPESLMSGPNVLIVPSIYRSMAECLKEISSISSIPNHVTVPCSLSWRLRALEFDNDGNTAPVEPGAAPPSECPMISTSLGEPTPPYRFCFSTVTSHVAWVLKTPKPQFLL